MNALKTIIFATSTLTAPTQKEIIRVLAWMASVEMDLFVQVKKIQLQISVEITFLL